MAKKTLAELVEAIKALTPQERRERAQAAAKVMYELVKRKTESESAKDFKRLNGTSHSRS